MSSLSETGRFEPGSSGTPHRPAAHRVQAARGQDLGDLRAQPGALGSRPQLGELADGNFVERGVNALTFGPPGTGKTHALCAVGHRLVESTSGSLRLTDLY